MNFFSYKALIVLMLPVLPVSAQDLSRYNTLHYLEHDTAYVDREMTPAEGAQRLFDFKETLGTLRIWDFRKSLVKEGMRKVLMTEGLEHKTSFNTVESVASMDKGRGYIVKNLAVEVMDGVWATGNLYLPEGYDNGRRYPALLSAQGHGAEGINGRSSRLEAEGQKMCALMARMGIVVYHYDQFGRGESELHFGAEAHKAPVTGCVHAVTASRLADYMLSLPYVDSDRFGMFGCSGGATQTFIAAALDERIKVAMNVTQVSCFFPGGCSCESGRPVHIVAEPNVSNAEIAAMMAPRPMLLVSDGQDWTRLSEGVEFPFIKYVYGLYGCPKNVEHVHLAEEGHGFQINKKIAVLDYISGQFGLDDSVIRNGKGGYDFESVPVLDWKRLLCFPKGRLPQGHVRSVKDIQTRLAGR